MLLQERNYIPIDINPIINAFQNEKILNQAEKKSLTIKQIKYWIYYLFGIFFNKKIHSTNKNFSVINGKRCKLISERDIFTKNERIYYGLISYNLFETFLCYSIFSEFSIPQRIKILVNSIRNYDCVKAKSVPLIYWIDYCFWYNWIFTANPISIHVYGHYDRLTTMLSHLSRIHGNKFSLQQHGVLGMKRIIPNMLLADIVYAFNELEKEHFRRNVIANKDCEYRIRYLSTPKFIEINNNKNYVIGIVDQPREKLEVLVRKLTQEITNATFYIMLYPTSPKDKFHDLKNDNVIVLKEEKVINVNLLITYCSTLFLDYQNHGYNGDILFVDDEDSFSDYAKFYNSIFHITDYIKIKEFINYRIERY